MWRASYPGCQEGVSEDPGSARGTEGGKEDATLRTSDEHEDTDRGRVRATLSKSKMRKTHDLIRIRQHRDIWSGFEIHVRVNQRNKASIRQERLLLLFLSLKFKNHDFYSFISED